MAESSRPMRPMVHHLHSLSGAKRARKTLPQKWRRTQRSRRPARASRCRSAIVPPLHPLVGISADVEDCGPGACPRARARCRALMGPRQRQRWPLAGAALPRRGGRAVLDEGSTGPADEAEKEEESFLPSSSFDEKGAFSSSPYTVPWCWVWGPGIAVLWSCQRVVRCVTVSACVSSSSSSSDEVSKRYC